MKLLIAIPALNEEASIATVIQRTLDTRADILARTAVTAVDITVVSDGSTDSTDDIVNEYRRGRDWIELLRLPEQRDRRDVEGGGNVGEALGTGGKGGTYIMVTGHADFPRASNRPVASNALSACGRMHCAGMT